MIQLRRIQPWESEQIVAHLMRLDERDRHLRFCCETSEAQIRRHVAQLDWTRDSLYGFDADGAIRGLVEFMPDTGDPPRAAEVAFSVEAEWRRRGFASRLMELALAVALLRGMRKVHLVTLYENVPMRQIAQRYGFRVKVIDGEVFAVTDLSTAEPTAFARDLVAGSDLTPLAAAVTAVPRARGGGGGGMRMH
jgi:RimJ/RimL family protein N-acetyltransferase